MKRNEAILLIKQILLHTNMVLKDDITWFEFHANKFAQSDAEDIIQLLEDCGIIDPSEIGAKCDRCEKGGWDSPETFEIEVEE